MRGMLLAAAFAIATVAAPALAQAPGTSAAPGATTPQSEPAPVSPQVPSGRAEQGTGRPWMHAGGDREMRAGPMMGQMMMHRMMMMRGDPQERCIDRLAWRAARRAYVEAKLDLTAEQRPLWDKVQSIAQSEQQKERQFCGQLKPREETTVLDRMDRAQQFLSARLDALQTAKPAVQALYQALTPDQREIFDHPFRP